MLFHLSGNWLHCSHTTEDAGSERGGKLIRMEFVLVVCLRLLVVANLSCLVGDLRAFMLASFEWDRLLGSLISPRTAFL